MFAAVLPRPDHVVVVVEEDRSYNQILGEASLPPVLWSIAPPQPADNATYLRGLAAHSAVFPNARSVGHISAITAQALFSGLDPARPEHLPGQPYTSPNLASELIAAGLTFGGYSESLPQAGYAGGDTGDYKRNHIPWVDFANVPPSDNLPFSSFPGDYSKLPTVSFVIPNLQNDMHSGTIAAGDAWFQQNIGPYARWATTHNSLLIVTWDESHSGGHGIPVIMYGPMVEEGRYSDPINQTNLLRTLEGMYGLAPTGLSANATAITGAFQSGGVTDPLADAGQQANRKRARGGGTVRGVVFASRTGATAPGHGNPGLAGSLVYLDANGDGQPEPDEPAVETDSRGRFVFRHLAAGTYTIRLVQQSGYATADPMSGQYIITIPPRHFTQTLLFSENPLP